MNKSKCDVLLGLCSVLWQPWDWMAVYGNCYSGAGDGHVLLHF